MNKREEFQAKAREYEALASEVLQMQADGKADSDGFDTKAAEALALKGQMAELKQLAELEQGIEDVNQPIGKMHHNVQPERKIETLRTQLFGEKGDAPFGLGESKTLTLDTKTLASLDAASVGDLVRTAYGPSVAYPDMPMRARDLFSSGTTDTNHLAYFVELAPTNNAAEVANTITGSDVVPESAIAWDLVNEYTHVVSHSLPVTETSMKNIPQVESMIRNRLLVGLDQRINKQLIWGGGTGDDINGLHNRTGLQTFSQGSYSILDAVKLMATKAFKASGILPTIAGMTPEIADQILLSKASGSGEYIFGAFAMLGATQVWGLRIVQDVAFENPANSVGYVFVGDPSNGEVTDQEQGNITVGYVDKQFAQNAQTLKGNASLALQVWRPGGYCEMAVAGVS